MRTPITSQGTSIIAYFAPTYRKLFNIVFFVVVVSVLVQAGSVRRATRILGR